MPHRPRKPPRRLAGGLKHGDLVHVAGTPIAFAAETDRVPANIDHFWITVGLGSREPIRIALSTHSRQNAAAGFDPRVRIGLVTSTWETLPPAALTRSPGVDYHILESASRVTYIEYERPPLEALFAEKAERSVFIEAWGELYVRTHMGIHNVHSMRASCSVPRDFKGRDGAIRFFFPDATAELILIKYCGQP